MKKIIAVMTALLACVTMLTACGNGTTAELEDNVTTTKATEATTTATETTTTATEATTTATETTTTAADTEKAAETTAADPGNQDVPDDGGAVKSFATLEELSKTDLTAIVPEQIPAQDSLTYQFTKTLEGADSLYLDVESTDGKMSMVLAVNSGSDIYTKVKEASSNTEMIILITNKTMYMLNPAEKTGLYYAVDESIFEEYNIEEAFSQMSVDENAISNAQSMNSGKVQVGGKEYTLEAVEGAGFLFKADGSIYAIVANDNSRDLNVLLINEFSKNAPADIFKVPSGYELVDLMSALGQ